MSPLVAAFIRCAFIPAAAVTVAVFLTAGVKEPLRARLHALFIALGFVAGHYLLIGRLGFPPADSGESISYAALGAALFVWLFPRLHQAPYLVRALFVVGLGAILLWHLGLRTDSQLWIRNTAAFFFLGLGIWSIFERNVSRVNTLSMIGLPLIVAGCLSGLMLFGASASFSQMVSILCAILGGLFVVALVWPDKVSKAAIVPFASVFLVLIMAAGHFYLDINPWKMVILCIPFVFIWTRGWYPFIPGHPIVEFLFLAIMSLIPLGYFMWDSFTKAGPLY